MKTFKDLYEDVRKNARWWLWCFWKMYLKMKKSNGWKT